LRSHLTTDARPAVILGVVLWLPFSLGAAMAMHAVLIAKLTSWPAWVQLLHPLATETGNRHLTPEWPKVIRSIQQLGFSGLRFKSKAL